jgi:hypothetical protein
VMGAVDEAALAITHVRDGGSSELTKRDAEARAAVDRVARPEGDVA